MTLLHEDRVPLHAQVAKHRAKRAFDVLFAILFLLLTLPLMLAVAVAVRLTSPGPAVFRQVRIGANGRSFVLLKFRSMQMDAEHVLHRSPELFERYLLNGHKLRLDEDPRITPIGRLLRRTSLDELPQLWNVVRGDMSLVGPRPVLASELENYGSRVDAYISARPGLTGPWQVNGRSEIDYVDRVAYDVDYVDSWSFSRDLVILAKTPIAVFCCRGSL